MIKINANTKEYFKVKIKSKLVNIDKPEIIFGFIFGRGIFRKK